MPDLPSRIKIGPFVYTVVASETQLNAARVKYDVVDRIGQSDRRRLEILIDPTLPHAVQAETLLHEAMHGACHVAGVIQQGRKFTEEEALEHITPTLLGTLRDNPALVAFLLEADDA